MNSNDNVDDEDEYGDVTEIFAVDVAAPATYNVAAAIHDADDDVVAANVAHSADDVVVAATIVLAIVVELPMLLSLLPNTPVELEPLTCAKPANCVCVRLCVKLGV